MMHVITATLALIGLLEPAAPLLPSNIVSPGIFRSEMVQMLRYSPTFRRQCGRIAQSPDLLIVVSMSSGPGMGPEEALTRIVRRPAGGLEADVQVGVLGDHIVLIAHEFEHILEQLDGVDLASMASRTATGVRLVSGSQHFETDRAIAIGRRVAEEVRFGRTRSGE